MSPLLLFFVAILISWIISSRLKSKFKKYSEIPLNSGMSGKDVAEKMLKDNGIYDVSIITVEGELTDNYNPAKKTVNLSPDVFYGKNVSAAAIAAHECGHALQHAQAYSYLQLRTALVPPVSIASRWVNWLLLLGIIFIRTFPQLLLIGIMLFALITLFSFVTLPVEINASRRALVWLNNSGITTQSTHPMAQDALKWAAYTYVMAALTSLATLMYYVMIYLGRRN